MKKKLRLILLMIGILLTSWASGETDASGKTPDVFERFPLKT